MDFANFDPTSGYLRPLSTVEIIGGSKDDLETSVIDYLTYGTVGAATSAAVGIMNTGIAVGELLGFAEDEDYIDEGRAINAVFGQNAAEFYANHKTGVDVAGLIAGSFVPGMMAVKALRAAQLAGKIPAPLQVATGLRNPDIVLNSNKLAKAKDAVLQTRISGLRNQQVREAYMGAVQQQFMEAAAFDLAVTTVMNQNAALNPDDLGYLEASKTVFFDSLPFTFLGGAAGSAIDVLRMKGAIAKNTTQEMERTGKYLVPNIKGLTGLTAGDKFVHIGKAMEEHNRLAKEIAPDDWFATSQFSRGRNQLNNYLLEAIKESGAKSDQVAILEGLVKTASENGESLESVATILSGLSKVDRLNTADFKDFAKFYEKTFSPTAVIEGVDVADIATKFEQRQMEFAKVLFDLGAEDFSAGISDAVFSGAARLSIMDAKSAQAFAFPSNPALQKITQSMRAEDNLLKLQVLGNGEQMYLVPDYIGLNNQNMKIGYEISKEYHKKLGKKFDITEEDYREYCLLHEIGHIKTNNKKVETLIANSLSDGKNLELVENMLEASIKSRRSAWSSQGVTAVDGFPKHDKDTAKNLLAALRDGTMSDPTKRPDWMKYLGSIRELLADGHAYMTAEKTRQVGSRQFPKLAEFFDKHGAFAKSWNDTAAIYNSRTGEVYSSFLPGIADISTNAKYSKGVLTVPELGRSFNISGKVFNAIEENLRGGKLDYLEYDAQWKVYANLDLRELADIEGMINITERNLPAMERAITQAEIDNFFLADKVTYNGKIVSKEDLRNELLKEKRDIQLKLSVIKDEMRYNEHHIAKILNIDVNPAMGFNTGKGDWILFGKKDFSKPELHKFGYKTNTPADYAESAINLSHSMIRSEMVDEQKQQAAAFVLGGDYRLFDEIDPYQIHAVSPTDSRAGLFTSLRPQLNTLRERAAYVGRLVNNKISNMIQSVDESYVRHIDTFNKADAGKLRFELAQVDNLLRRQWYYLVRTQNGKNYIVEKHSLLKQWKQEFEELEFDGRMLDDVPDEFIAGLSSRQVANDPAVVTLSNQVADFYRQHRNTNMEIVGKKKKIAEARGKENVMDEFVLYPPPKDLSVTKYHGFVIPTEFMAGSDPRRFMIFAESVAEFEAKKQAILDKWGDKYRIVTQEQVSDYKNLKDAYSKDLVFDEMFFDASIARKGRTSELLPNMDINSSATLDRYRNWTIRQNSTIIRSGVELRYDTVIQQLKSLDKEFGVAERSAMDKRFKEPDSIWKDTVSVMLDQKSYGGPLEDLFSRVNDYIGEAGSRVLDSAMAIFRKPTGTRFTEQDYKKYNEELRLAGYNPPTVDATAAILASPDTLKSNTLPHLVRTLSNLASTLMLRMDFAHSILQTVSTPILALPVLQEAKAALKGSAKGKMLDDLTGVANPVDGQYEPTAAKLLARGAKAFFSDEGKEFMKSLRDRNIVSDYIIRYLDTLDFSSFNGSHTLHQVGEKIDSVAQFASKFSGFKFSEEFSRFQVAWAVKEIGELRGLPIDELWSTISSSVDKVHGVYQGSQRVQLFQGVLGQSIGLYQTYFFNFMQNMLKYVADGDKKQLLTMGAMQGSLFGLQSFPGFAQLNQMIGESNRDNLDLYSITGANDPQGNSKYLMFGLGSHILGFPIDFYTRGDLAVRHSLVIPTNVEDFPVVSTIAKAVRNINETGKLILGGDVPVTQALMQGLAHNGMNRPLQGIATIMRNRVTTGNAQINFDNVNYVPSEIGEELNWGAMFARVLGTRPLNESIIMNNFYRQAGYDANNAREIERIAKKIQLNIADGTVSMQDYKGFARDYELAGGKIQNFNAFYVRQLKQASRPVMEDFYQEMQRDSEMARVRKRMEVEQSLQTPWANDPLYTQ